MSLCVNSYMLHTFSCTLYQETLSGHNCVLLLLCLCYYVYVWVYEWVCWTHVVKCHVCVHVCVCVCVWIAACVLESCPCLDIMSR